MPWEVKKLGTKGRPWCVVKEGTDDVVSCHPTSSKAQQHVQALYANAKESTPAP